MAPLLNFSDAFQRRQWTEIDRTLHAAGFRRDENNVCQLEDIRVDDVDREFYLDSIGGE